MALTFKLSILFISSAFSFLYSSRPKWSSSSLPDGVEGRDGDLPLPLDSLGSDEVFCKVVGEFAGFPHEGFVLQVFACYLLVNVLKANEERPVTEPAGENKREERESPGLLLAAAAVVGGYRGDCASAIHIRSMLQASTGR